MKFEYEMSVLAIADLDSIWNSLQPFNTLVEVTPFEYSLFQNEGSKDKLLEQSLTVIYGSLEFNRLRYLEGLNKATDLIKQLNYHLSDINNN